MHCDTESPKFYSHSEPVARKRHRCDECNAPIEIGERHFRYVGKWDEIMQGRQHLLCMEACMLIRDEFQGGECIPFGGLKDIFFEMRLDWMASPNWKKLRRMMTRIKWRERKHTRIIDERR